PHPALPSFPTRRSSDLPRVAIVNQMFVKKFLDGAKNAIGKQFRVWAPPGQPARYYTVAGEVKDSVYDDMHDPMQAVMYFPRTQLDRKSTRLNSSHLVIS